MWARAPRRAPDPPGGRRDEGGHPGDVARLTVRARQDRRPVDRPHEADQPGERAHRRVRCREVPIGAAFAEPRQGHDGQAGVGGAQSGMAEDSGFHLGRRPCVQQDIGGFKQGTHAGGVGREIGDDALLVGVQPRERAALHPALARVQQRRDRAARIAHRRLQLDNVGAEIGEQLAAILEPGRTADLQHAQAGERHRVSGLVHASVRPSKVPSGHLARSIRVAR